MALGTRLAAGVVLASSFDVVGGQFRYVSRRTLASCDDDEHWTSIRVHLDSYAGKYIRNTPLLKALAAEGMLYALTHGLTVKYHHEDHFCPIGDVALRLLYYSYLDATNVMFALPKLCRRRIETKDGFDDKTVTLHNTLHDLFAMQFEWVEIMDSGWPLFSVLASTQEAFWRYVSLSNNTFNKQLLQFIECEDVSMWDGKLFLPALLRSLDSGEMLPLHATLSVLLAMNRTTCPLAFATVLLCIADSLKWNQHDNDANLLFSSKGAHENLGSLNRAAFLRHNRYANLLDVELGRRGGDEGNGGSSWDSKRFADIYSGRDHLYLVAVAERIIRHKFVRLGHPKATLLTAWPIWRQLDRLACSEWVEVRCEAPAPPKSLSQLQTEKLLSNLQSYMPTFFMHVFPHRAGVDGLQSSVTRAKKVPYCSQVFQRQLDLWRLRAFGIGCKAVVANKTLALTSLAFADKPILRVIEVGPHLGDCLLWAAARVGCSHLRATGVEPVPQITLLFKKSIVRNNFGSCVEARIAFVGETDDDTSFPPVVTLDSTFGDERMYVHLLKIHTGQIDDGVLRGAWRLLTRPDAGVGTIVLWGQFVENHLRMLDLFEALARIGIHYDLELDNEVLPADADLRRDRVRALRLDKGGMDILATRRDLCQFLT